MAIQLDKEIATIQQLMDRMEYRTCTYQGISNLSHSDMEEILDWIGRFATGNTAGRIPPCGGVGQVLVKLGIYDEKDCLEYKG